MSYIPTIDRLLQRRTRTVRPLKPVAPSVKPTTERDSSAIEIVARHRSAPLLEPTHRLLREL